MFLQQTFLSLGLEVSCDVVSSFFGAETADDAWGNAFELLQFYGNKDNEWSETAYIKVQYLLFEDKGSFDAIYEDFTNFKKGIDNPFEEEVVGDYMCSRMVDADEDFFNV